MWTYSQKEFCVPVLSLGGWGTIRAPVSLIHGRVKQEGGLGSFAGPEYLLMALWVWTHIQKIHCVCLGEAERCNGARSGCGWQTDWQAGRHDDLLSLGESAHLRHALHRPHLSVCPSPCLFPLSHRFFLPSLTFTLALYFFPLHHLL